MTFRHWAVAGLVLAMAGMAKGQKCNPNMTCGAMPGEITQDAKPFNWHDCKPGQYIGVDKCVDPPKPEGKALKALPLDDLGCRTSGDGNSLICTVPSHSALSTSELPFTPQPPLVGGINTCEASDEIAEYWRQKYLAEVTQTIKRDQQIIAKIEKMQKMVDAMTKPNVK